MYHIQQFTVILSEESLMMNHSKYKKIKYSRYTCKQITCIRGTCTQTHTCGETLSRKTTDVEYSQNKPKCGAKRGIPATSQRFVHFKQKPKATAMFPSSILVDSLTPGGRGEGKMSLSRGFAKGSAYILRGEGGGCRYGCKLKNMCETDAGMSIQIYFCIAFFAAYFV